VILLSAGGNDIGLTKILNQCIYQWFALTPDQAVLAELADYSEENWDWVDNFDFESAGIGCEAQLQTSEILAGGKEFAQTLDSLLWAAKAKLAPG
jgi:hypothetical protein